jgi:hypothetical protein
VEGVDRKRLTGREKGSDRVYTKVATSCFRNQIHCAGKGMGKMDEVLK